MYVCLDRGGGCVTFGYWYAYVVAEIEKDFFCSQTLLLQMTKLSVGKKAVNLCETLSYRHGAEVEKLIPVHLYDRYFNLYNPSHYAFRSETLFS